MHIRFNYVDRMKLISQKESTKQDVLFRCHGISHEKNDINSSHRTVKAINTQPVF